jgi:hypothetical protein
MLNAKEAGLSSPLCRNSFEEIDGFLTLVDEPEHDEIPGMSFNQTRIYVAREKSVELLRQFQVLRNRLNDYLMG